MTSKEITKTTRIAGILYLIAVPLAIFSAMVVPSNLIVPGDAATTANNITVSKGLFRSGIVCMLIVQIIYIFKPLILYKLLKPVNKTHALLMVILMLVAIPIAFINELNKFAALLLLSGADYLTVFDPGQLYAQVMFFLDLYTGGVFIAQIFWGLWLFPLGYLVYKSGFLPRILGVLLIIGCFGYVIDSLAFMLFPSYQETVALVAMAPNFISEFG